MVVTWWVFLSTMLNNCRGSGSWTLPFGRARRRGYGQNENCWNVYGTKDYRVFRDILMGIDVLLSQGGLEAQLIEGELAQHVNKRRFTSEVQLS